ncbi:class F sortase [Pseudarthrobacter sp. NPDC058329]|uniref:class F sortase n=1 Tax=Pseudarthrobacter sp. NPDC058329 TaxID=3346448 RepID=UPI0036DC2545
MSKERSRHAAPKARRYRRWNRADLAILLCGVLAFFSITFGAPVLQQAGLSAGGGGTAISSAPSASRSMEQEPAALPGTPPGATPVPGGSPVRQAAAPALPAAAPPVRIRYASAAFDVPVHALELDAATQASQTIVPPATKDGYWLTPFGTPGTGSTNTTYVIGHSWEGADAPFNHLSSAATVGDELEMETTAGTIPYRVESVTTYLKSGLKDSPVWDMVPNRLVLISCYTEDPWGKNVVVTAVPAAS